MPYTFRNRRIAKVAVIGSGQIGPDIALYFAKVLAPSEVSIVVVDIAQAALESGQKKLDRKIDKGIESGAFTADAGSAMKAAVSFHADYDALRDADFVVEAATEDLAIKHKIVAQVEELVAPEAILASNSSHLEPDLIFAQARHPERCAVIHYFFPAERNPVVEIVPGEGAAPDLADFLLGLYEDIGKAPILAGARYGYALDPIFEGLFHAACLAVEKGLGSVKEVDFVAAKALRQTLGPFTAMNLTGGNPITFIGLKHYREKIHPWFKVSDLLARAMEEKTPWETAARGESVSVPEDRARLITEWMQGAYIGLAAEIISAGLATVADLDMAGELALDIAPPFRFMNELGLDRALRLFEDFQDDNPAFPMPGALAIQADLGEPWEIEFVQRHMAERTLVLTIRRPKVLNALNETVFAELEEIFRAADEDDDADAVVLTGFGKKAFVSGADIHFLAAISSAKQAEATCLASQKAINAVATCSKPVVCAMNGMALGGGLELAMACDARIARAGLPLLAGQPEVNLGIIPGAGGTQRLPRLIGFDHAARMLRTGKPLSSEAALRCGLIQEAVDGDLLEAALRWAADLVSGAKEAARVPAQPLSQAPDALPALDLGHLSRAIDAILCRAILDGAKLPLLEGLKLEARLFGECYRTEDMHLGLKNFIAKGPRSKAEFVHR